jgi:hypothetical protein
VTTSRRLPWLLALGLLVAGCTARPGDDDDLVGDDDSAGEDDSSGDDDSADDDDSSGDDDSTPPANSFHWYFSLHATEVDYDLVQTAAAFEQILMLGGSGVRIDIFWYDIEPQQGQWDQAMLDYYDAMVTLARDMDVEPMIIISNAPDWAVDLYGSDPTTFWQRYEIYAQRVVDLVGDRVSHYQLWNEANHLIDPFASTDDWQLFARAGAIFRSSDPGCVLYINVMANLLGWEDAVTDWVIHAWDYIDVIGVDHYAGTWATVPYDDWGPVDTLLARINDPADPWYGKQGAMLEAGYSSWALSIADENDQRDWINEALPSLRDRVAEAAATQEHSIWVGNYYQLIDVDTDGVGQEAHFGILHSDGTAKVGYDTLQKQISLFGSL